MDIKPRNNKEDDYLTKKRDDVLSPEEEQMIANCNVKEKLISLAKQLIYKPTEPGYLETWKEISVMTLDNPADNAELDTFRAYLEDNWHLHADRWATYHMKHYNLKGTFTNNRSENCNKIIKMRINRQSRISTVVSELYNLQKEQACQRKKRNWQAYNKTYSPTHLKLGK